MIMNTKIVYVDAKNQDSAVREAGVVIQSGGIVAFPTETVYGLGANALNPKAVLKIFEAKGRPQDNPLIVHVASKDITDYVETIPGIANQLIDRFWPGPLTIILKKSALIPLETSAGLDTVGLRMPNHELALALIKAAKVPIAAPSANLSGKPSPTDVLHCIEDLNGRVDFILGGETSQVGLESTIVDCTQFPPVVLRPGGINLEQLQEIEAGIYLDPQLLIQDSNQAPKAPGMKYRHYAPVAPMKIIDLGDETVFTIQRLIKEYQLEGKVVGVIATDEQLPYYKDVIVRTLGSKNNLALIGKNLYDVLRKMDELEVDVILSPGFEEKGLGVAIMNRLKKAASFDIITKT
jgi:L-threonylcarbamoyladenylate synthase